VWDGAGQCWQEDQGYFDSLAWPEYVRHRTQAEAVEGVTLLESDHSTVEQNAVTVARDIIRLLTTGTECGDGGSR